MTRRVRTGLLMIGTLICMICAGTTAYAQNNDIQENQLSKRDSKKLAEQIADDYKPWNKVAINGKVRAEMLPIALTMRVAMERDKRLAISIRAPFLGEVMRIEMTPGDLYIINKKAKTYHQLEYDAERQLLQYAQDILLGRVVVVGHGVLSRNNADKCSIYALTAPSDNGETPSGTGYAIIPSPFADGLSYGYTLDSGYRITGLSIAVVQKLIAAVKGGNTTTEIIEDDYVPVANADISYRNSGKATANIAVNFDKFSMNAVLECDAPEYGAKLLEPFELTSAYRSVSLRDVIRF